MSPASLLKLAAITIFAARSAQAVTIDFSGATDFANNFASPAGSMDRNATAGVSGGGGGRIFNSNRAIYTGAADQIPALASADSVTISTFFQRSATDFTSGGARLFALGLSSENSALASGAGGLGQAGLGEANFGFALFSNASASNEIRLRTFDSYNNVAPTTSANLGALFTVTPGNWYKFEVTFTKSSTTGTWESTALISDYGATGAGFVSTVKSLSSTSVAGSGAAAAYGDSTLYAGFSGASAFGNRFDDFTLTTTVAAVPEPSSAAALAGLGALGLVASRRRRSAR